MAKQETEAPSETGAAETRVKKTSRRELQSRIEELNDEYRSLGIEARSGNGAAQARQSEIARDLRALSTTLYLREPDVEVKVTRSPTGHPYRIGDQVFNPGVHVVKKSVAQYLAWLMDRSQLAEINRLKSNGEDVDLGAVGQRVTMVPDDGRSI